MKRLALITSSVVLAVGVGFVTLPNIARAWNPEDCYFSGGTWGQKIQDGHIVDTCNCGGTEFNPDTHFCLDGWIFRIRPLND